MLKTILFTHDDLDGAGCRIIYELAHQHLQKGTDYLVVNCPNGGADENVMRVIESGIIDKNTEICFGDIVASRETLEYLVKNFNMPKIWDHHRTNFFATWIVPDAVIVPENELGVMQSGTSLMYQYYSALAIENPTNTRSKFFSSNYIPNDKKELVNVVSSKSGLRYKIEGAKKRQEFIGEFIDTIRSYDTYEWKETSNITAKKLQTLFILLGMEKFCEYYLNRIIDMDKHSLTSNDIISKEDIKFVDAKLENEQRIIDSITPDDVYQIYVRGYKTAFALGGFGVNVSELAHQFLTKYPEFDIFVSFSLWRGGEFQFRTKRDNIDVGKDIALPIGGGGHPKASGARLDEEVREEIVQMLINHLNKRNVDILDEANELPEPLQILVANANK